MNSVYVFYSTMKFIGSFHSLAAAKEYVANNITENVIYLEEINMNYISKITFVNDECIYNNKTFWTQTAWKDEIVENYANYVVKDWLGNTIDSTRFQEELYQNNNRLCSIDGQPGETNLNQIVGRELISLLMSEYSQTTTTTVDANTVATKCGNIASYLTIGSFALAEAYLSTIENDEFFTTTLVNKYLAMLKSADVFTYAS